MKGLPQPLLPFWGAERPLTQLLKTAFTFILSQHSLAHGGRECSAFKQKEQRKYINIYINISTSLKYPWYIFIFLITME